MLFRSVHRTGLLRALQAIVRELPNVRLFLTGRPFIRGEVESYFPGMDAISVSPTREDIEEFLRIKLDEDTEPDAMDENLRADIMEIIPKTISEMYVRIASFPFRAEVTLLTSLLYTDSFLSLSTSLQS